MKTIETELKKYRMCRAEMERGCYMVCEYCPNNIPGSTMALFGALDGKMMSGEAPP